ncbi:hypothetical protein ACC827_26535 [Rhizobium ruizarguesonis]
MAKTEAVKNEKVSVSVRDEGVRLAEAERVIRESNAQYRAFIDSLNKSSDREIERALSRM